MEKKQQETEKAALSEEFATQATSGGTMTFSDTVATQTGTGLGGKIERYTNQGFTMNPNTGKCFLTMLENGSNDKVRLAKVSYFDNPGKVTDVYPEDAVLKYGHANDCTYYDGRIYIVQGGGMGTKIKSFTTSLDDEKTYSYTYHDTTACLDMNYFNAICYQSGSGGWFILGGKGTVKKADGTEGTEEKFVTAYFNGSEFIGVKSFTLPDIEDKISIAGRTLQHQTGVVKNNAYYRIYNQEEENAPTRKNTVVSYALPGFFPSFSGEAFYVAHYNNVNKEDKRKFEMEGLAYYNDEMYASANVKDTKDSGLQTKIFKVTFKD